MNKVNNLGMEIFINQRIQLTKIRAMIVQREAPRAKNF
jgi:hypothetical protein